MEPAQRQRLWTIDYLRAFTAMLGVNIVFITLMAYMTIYAIREFQVDETAGGIAASAFVAGGALSRILIGKYLDFVGRKRTLAVTLAVFVVCSLIYPVIDHYGLLVLLRFIHGAAFGISSTVISSVAVTLIPAKRLSEGLGYISLAGTIANAIGPFAAIQLHEHASSLWVFGFTTVCAVVSFLAVLPMQIAERKPSPEEYQRRWRLRAFDLVDFKVVPLAIVGLLTTLSFSVVMTYLPSYLMGMNMASTASTFFFIWAMGMFLVRLFAGRIQDRYGENVVIPAALVSLVAGLVIISVADSLWQFIIAAFLGGLGHGTVLPGLQAVAVKRTTPERIPIAVSTHYIALDSGLAIGPPMLGFIIGLAGYPYLYVAGAGLALLGLVIYWVAHGKYARPPATDRQRCRPLMPGKR